MSASRKIEHNFGELNKARFAKGETPIRVWGEPNTEVDVIEHLRFNIGQLRDLNSRFKFLLEELSGVLVKKNQR